MTEIDSASDSTGILTACIPLAHASNYISQKDFSNVPTEIDSSFSSDGYVDVVQEEALENKPMNRTYTAACLWTFCLLQGALVIIAFTKTWSKTRLLNQSDYSIISELSTTDVWSNIEMYEDSDCWEIVILIVVFCVFFPMFRFVLFAMGTYSQHKYFKHEEWPIESSAQAKMISKETNEQNLMPWWHVDINGEWFSTKEGMMKVASIGIDILVICTKFSFAQIVLCLMLNWCMGVEFELELDNGNVINAEINSKTFGGFISYGLSLFLSTIMVCLLVLQRVFWLRSYKERSIKGLPKEENEHLDFLELDDALDQPLLTEGQSYEQFSEPVDIDYKLAFLWTMAFSSWLAIVSGVDLAKVKYTGSWTEGMSTDHKTNSFFGLIRDSYDFNHETNPVFRAFLPCNFTTTSFVYATTLLFLLGYLVISKLSKRMFNGSIYRKVLIAVKALYPMSTHEPLFGAGAIFILEVRRISDPLLNSTDDCSEEKCLLIKGQFTPGLLALALYAISMTVLYRILSRKYMYKIYEM